MKIHKLSEHFSWVQFHKFSWNEQCITNPRKLQFVHSIQQFIIHENMNCSIHGDHENSMVTAWRKKWENINDMDTGHLMVSFWQFKILLTITEQVTLSVGWLPLNH